MLIVQKYGGTSVGSPERIKRVAQRVAAERKFGHEIVVVVSAMGHSTDELIALAAQIAADARRNHPRELDMLLTAGERIAMALLAMAIRELGVEAISLTGSQAAIITDETHTGARIQEVRATRVREELQRGRVVIVAGFQGVSARAKEVTTLGRGGSDTTAVALAAALPADRCDIFTDVDGVFTSDPRRVKSARLLSKIDYQEMVELATSGAQVMHPRAVEIGARYNVPIRVLSSFKDNGDGGTLITRRDPTMEGLTLTGLACEGGYARLAFRGLPPEMRVTSDILTRLAAARISVDMLAQVDDDGKRLLQLTIPEDALKEGRPLCDELLREHRGETLDVTTGLTRVALVGSGMYGLPGVYARTYRALQEANIEVHAVSSSSISISLLVDSKNEERSLQVLHDAFDLGEGGE